MTYAGAAPGASYVPPPPPDPPDPPDVPPDPPGTRPFDAPVTTGTVTVPGSIPHTGAADASADLQDFLDNDVPDGSIVDFAIPGAVYRLDEGWHYYARNHLVVRGHGNTTLEMNVTDDELNSTFHLRGSNHLAFADFIVSGSYAVYPTPDGEESHLLGLSGWTGGRESSYIEMSGMVADHLFGDFVYAEGENVGDQRPSHHLWVHDNDFDYCGRNGFSTINLTDAWFEDNDMDHMAYHIFDVEPNQLIEEVRRVYFRRNVCGEYAARGVLIGFFFNAYAPNGSPITNITVQANTVAGIAANGYDGQPRCLDTTIQGQTTNRFQGIAVLDNVGSRTVAGGAGTIYATHTDNLIVTGNTQPLSSGALVGISDCPNATITPNP